MTDTPNTPTTDTTASVANSGDAQIVLLENGKKVQLNMPTEAGQQAVVVAKGVSQIVANFDADQAEVTYEGDSLIFKFEDGSQTVIEQFGLEDPMPEIVLQDGTIVAGDTIVAQLDGADDIFTLETAAGGAQSGGGSSYSEDLGDVIDMLDANGPLPFGSFVRETADDEEFDGLDAGGPGAVPFDDAPEIGSAATVLDETDDMGGIISGTIPIDFGADGPGTVSPKDASDVTTSVPLMSGGEPVTIIVTPTGYAGVLPSGEPVFELVLNDDGTYTYQQLLPLDHPDGMDPNDPIEIDFCVEATDSDGDAVIGNIVVTILDDGPILVDGSNIVDETTDLGMTVTGSLDIDAGEDGIGSIEPNGDFDSSVPLTSGGEPVTVTLTGENTLSWVGAEPGQTMYQGTLPDGTVVFELILNADGTYEFTQFLPLDHPDTSDMNDLIELEFGIVLTDGDGDSVVGTITIGVLDDGPIVYDQQMNQMFLSDNGVMGATHYGDPVLFDYGEDGAGSIDVSGAFNSSEVLMSGGQAVTVVEGPNGYVGTLADGTVVFEMTLNPDGSYSFTQYEPLDHPDGVDQISLDFGVIVTDGDGDTDTGNITVYINDGGPEIDANGGLVVDETHTIGVPVQGQIDIDFGGDGPGGAITPIQVNGNFTSSVPLTSGGLPVTLGLVPNVGSHPAYVGVLPDGTEVFHITFNADGSYTFTQLLPLDHPDSMDPDDLIELNFGLTITDGDGDSIDITVTVGVHDDGPVAVDDWDFVNDKGVATGNVLTGEGTFGYTEPDPDVIFDDGFEAGGGADDIGADNGPNVQITSVHVGPEDTDPFEYPVEAGGSVTIEGSYGILTIHSDGSYTYELFPDAEIDPNNPYDIFTYTMVDGDGDTDTAELVLDHTALINDVPEIGDDEITLDETDGFGITVSDALDVDFGDDGAGSVDANGTVDSTVPLTSGGETVTVTEGPNGYVGTLADGTVIFELNINDDGTYDFTQYGPLDHPDSSDPNDVISIDFGVTISDADGDTDTGTITVNILDDGPELVEMSKALVNEGFDLGVPMQGSITFDYGADSEGIAELTGNFTAVAPHSSGNTPIELTHNGQPITMEPNPSGDGFVGVTPDGSVAFTVTMSPDGSYVYTQLLPFDHPGADADGLDRIRLRFEVTGTDADGDVVTSQIVIMIDDSRPVALDDVDSFGQNDTILTGNVVTGEGTDTGNADIIGGDVEGHHIINVHVGPEGNGAAPVTILEGGSVQIEGLYGTLTLHSDGSYSYVLNGPVDPNNPVDVFTYTIVDGDGDTDQATLTIDATTIANDTDPEIADEVLTIDETDQIGDVVQGTLDIDYGNDGPGTISLNGATSTSVTSLTSGGAAVTIVMTANGYVGTLADGTPVFTLNIGANGAYNFTQHLPLDHPNTGDHDDVISLNFGVIATDSDGDTDVADITINIHDDGPEAANDWNHVGYNDADRTVDGNILNNDSFGEDGGSTVTAINGVEVPATGTVTINGFYGVLTISADGSYSYTANPGSEGRIENFTYTIHDGDGDVDSAILQINIAGAPPGPDPVIVDADIIVAEGVLVPGSNAAHGTIQIDHFGDFESVQFTGMVSNASQGQTSEGNLITFQQISPYEFRAVADGQTVFTVTLSNDGSYTVSMNQNVDHGPGHHFTDMLDFSFSFQATDDEGNTVNGWLTVDIADDNPHANHDFYTVSEDGFSSGNVTVNDDMSTVDSAGSFVHMVTHWDDPSVVDVPGFGDSQNISNGGSTTITGNYGVLTLHSDGSYTYEPFDNLDLTGPVQDCFSYQLLETDGDGSYNGAHLFFTVTPDGTTSVAPALDITDMSDTSGEEAADAMDDDHVDLGELIAMDDAMIGPPDQGIGLTVEDPMPLGEPDMIKLESDYSYDAGDVIDLSELIDIDSGSVEEIAIENFVRFDADSGVLQVDASGQGSFDAENTQEVAVHGYDGGNIKLAIEDMVVDTDFTS